MSFCFTLFIKFEGWILVSFLRWIKYFKAESQRTLIKKEKNGFLQYRLIFFQINLFTWNWYWFYCKIKLIFPPQYPL